MNLTEVFQLIQAIAAIATVIAVMLAWLQIRHVKKQAITTFEDALDRQYRKIMEDIPTNVWMGSDLGALDKERQDHCRDAIYRYIDLSNGQAFLHKRDRVTKKAWDQWIEGIGSNMKLPAFREVWTQVKEKCPESFTELRTELDQRTRAGGSSKWISR